MIESSNDKRIKFIKKGDQRKFIILVQGLTYFTNIKLAEISCVSSRQFREWKNEKSTMTLFAFKTLCKIAGINEPKNVRTVDAYEHTSRAGKLGGKKTFEKYKKMPFSEEQRLVGWKKWWENTGKNNLNPILLRKKLKEPKESANFAEFFGILIGDGGITKYQVTITLNNETDLEYSVYIINLVKKIFKIQPRIYKIKDAKAINISISSINLVEFLISKGMKLGHKINQGLLIPDWIMNSELYQKKCLRGMVDTDGSVFVEKHIIKNKKYEYPRLNYSSGSPHLIKQVYTILSELGFNPKVRNRGKSVQLEKLEEICQYFNIVGSSNPKHTERIRPWY